MWFRSDLQKLDFMCFFAVRLPEINLDTVWICQKFYLGCQSDGALTVYVTKHCHIHHSSKK